RGPLRSPLRGFHDRAGHARPDAGDGRYGAVLADPDLKARLRQMMEEVVAVAAARNIQLPADAIDKTMAQVGRFAFDAKTSMQLDREKGKPTEIDTLTAYLIEAGLESGIPTPAHDEAYRQLTSS
ncbi:MAG: ketopantoate reductase C-terminal domain-containing protein, partial [Smithellaceae bacterium]